MINCLEIRDDYSYKFEAVNILKSHMIEKDFDMMIYLIRNAYYNGKRDGKKELWDLFKEKGLL